MTAFTGQTVPHYKKGFRASGLGLVLLKVYDLLGRGVKTLVNEVKGPGVYTVEFSAIGGDGSNLAAGVYFYQLRAGDFVQTKKLLLL